LTMFITHQKWVFLGVSRNRRKWAFLAVFGCLQNRGFLDLWTLSGFLGFNMSLSAHVGY
jgi:putative flippase GtrA